MTPGPSPQFITATAPHPGAVGIVQLMGEGAADIVEKLTGKRPTQRVQLATMEQIDEGLIVALRDDWCQLMPHGGMRVMQLLAERLVELGATPAAQIDNIQLYPEADSPIEADMLAALANAASPAAVDRLMAQPQLWRDAITRNTINRQQIEAQSRVLDQLMHPPRIVVIGAANVGKSTLTNHLAGRAASIVADLPGTTRDWVGTLVELPTPIGDVAVQWFDTPGMRQSDDPIEQRAIELAKRVITSADVLVAMRDELSDWPTTDRRPDVRVINKIDRPDAAALVKQHAGAIGLAAAQGTGVDQLAAAIADRLGQTDVPADALWAFAPGLVGAMRDGQLPGYCRPTAAHG